MKNMRSIWCRKIWLYFSSPSTPNPPHSLTMNFLVWNCRGAGGKHFPALIKDCLHIYKLKFVALLEPRIHGTTADRVIQRIGLDGVVKVDANGFSGGLWCLWNPAHLNVNVISSSRYCVHLRLNSTLANSWMLTIVYASPQPALQSAVWEELLSFKPSITCPWLVAGDFNCVLHAAKKVGGVPFNDRLRGSFATCVEECSLINLDFKGSPFTFSRGTL